MSERRSWKLGGALGAVLVTGSLSAFAADDAFTEKLSVPLTDPSRPAHVEVSLVMGGITVVGGNVQEILVEATARPDGGDSAWECEDCDHEDAPAIAGTHETWERRKEKDRPESASDEAKRRGMKRIPNVALGLEAQERNNRVEIGSDSWRQAVDLKITVPAGSSLKLSSVNDGDIEVRGVTGELELHNTNGSITVADASGPVSASTVNGDLLVGFQKSSKPASAMAFSTLNGDIELTLPAGFKADVRLRSDNGEIYSDFDVVLERKPARVEQERGKSGYRVVLAREIAGKIGGGGAELLLKTFNGDILLKKAE